MRRVLDVETKYTRELRRILFVKLPPHNGWSLGMTGNFLIVSVKISSSRKFMRYKGWYYTVYAVTNRYAKLSERVMLKRVNRKIVERLRRRFRTTDVESVKLKDVVAFVKSYNVFNNAIRKTYVYVTLLDDARFYVLSMRKYFDVLSCMRNYVFKAFRFERFKSIIVNFVSDDSEAVETVKEYIIRKPLRSAHHFSPGSFESDLEFSINDSNF